MTQETMQLLVVLNSLVSGLLILFVIIMVIDAWVSEPTPEEHKPYWLFKNIRYMQEDIGYIEARIKKLEEELETLDVSVSILEENQEKEVIEE